MEILSPINIFALLRAQQLVKILLKSWGYKVGELNDREHHLTFSKMLLVPLFVKLVCAVRAAWRELYGPTLMRLQGVLLIMIFCRRHYIRKALTRL